MAHHGLVLLAGFRAGHCHARLRELDQAIRKEVGRVHAHVLFSLV